LQQEQVYPGEGGITDVGDDHVHNRVRLIVHEVQHRLGVAGELELSRRDARRRLRRPGEGQCARGHGGRNRGGAPDELELP
jgi:hypothetical protein